MIRLPRRMHPSELLWLRDIPAPVTDLLKTSRSLRWAGRWREAEELATTALDRSQGLGAQVSRAATLVHLFDIHLVTARMAMALEDARGAYRLFAAQPSRYQRHNEAVAAYARGLVCQSLGDPIEARRWYRKSTQLFNRVTLAWSAQNALSRVRCCRRAQRWIEALMDCLTDTDVRVSTAGHASLWLPLLLSESDAVFTLARLEVERYLLADTMELAGRTFKIQRLDGTGQPSLPADGDCYVLRIPGQALQLLDADDGDYAVIVRRRDADLEGPGVLETLSGVEFGDFRRDPSGRISFVRPDATVIGGEIIGEDLPVGYVAALLRPASR